MLKKYVAIIIMLCCLATAWGQNGHKIALHADSLHQPYSDPLSPGMSGAIVEKGKLIYSTTQGKANPLEDAVVNDRTLYNIGDLAKQFTSYGLLRLIADGRVQRRDHLGQHLPQLPAWKDQVTIDHLLNHTTGLNNVALMHLIVGETGSALSQSRALELINGQQDLAFAPGTSFSQYDSETESILMAALIEAVTALPFAQFMREEVFAPLGLDDAVIAMHNDLIGGNLAWSFQKDDQSELSLVPMDDLTVGANNTFMSLRDLSRWYTLLTENSRDPLIEQLDVPVRNSAGNPYWSSWGRMTQGRSYWHHERGIPMYWQFGLNGAYGVNAFRWPEQQLAGIAMGNNSRYNGYPAMFQVEPLLQEHFLYPSQIGVADIPVIDLPTSELSRWAGEYFYEEEGQIRKIEVRNDTMWYVRPSSSLPLYPLGDNRFQLLLGSDDLVFFEFWINDQGQKGYTFFFGEGEPYQYREIPSASEDISLDEFEGTFINSDWGLMVESGSQEGALVLSMSLKDPIRFRHVHGDFFSSNSPLFSGLHFERKGGKIDAFRVLRLGAHMRFEKR